MADAAGETPGEYTRFLMMFAPAEYAAAVTPLITERLGAAASQGTAIGAIKLETYYDNREPHDEPTQLILRSPETPGSFHPRDRMKSALGLIVVRRAFEAGAGPAVSRLSQKLGVLAAELRTPQASLIPITSWRHTTFRSYCATKRLGNLNQHTRPTPNVILTMSADNTLNDPGTAAFTSWLDMVIEQAA